MTLLDEAALERSATVANSTMNRQRRAVGVNSYERDLWLDPIAFLSARIATAGSAAWLDLCCGRGCALIDTAKTFHATGACAALAIDGVDLVDMFDAVGDGAECLQLAAVSLRVWRATRRYDLITCVHGLHYVGDKLALIERSATWLEPEGTLLMNFDPANVRRADGSTMGTEIVKTLRGSGFSYDTRRHLLSCVGHREVTFGYRFIGADDSTGANYSGQEAVDSYYEADE